MIIDWLKKIFGTASRETYGLNEAKCYEFSSGQLEQIQIAREMGLSDRQIQLISDPQVDTFAMWDMRDELLYTLDIPFLIERYKPPLKVNRAPRYFGLVATFGGIFGDITGSRYESISCDRVDLCLEKAISSRSHITDDSILLLATLEAAKNGDTDKELRDLLQKYDGVFKDENFPFGDTAYTKSYRKYYHAFPSAGYGGGFIYWALEGNGPYRSFGNGSAMRVAPIGELFEEVEDVILHAIASAACTHNHPEGIKGAVVVAVCIWMGRHGYSKDEILSYAERHYTNQNLIQKYSMNELRSCKQSYYATSCQFTVPAAITCFIESENFKQCIENALSFNGDSDTIAAIAGAICTAYDGQTSKIIIDVCAEKMPDSLKYLLDFNSQFP